MENDIKEKFLLFVCRHFIVERHEIDLNKSLIDEGIIDSVGLIEIASYLEQEFNILIHEEDMIRDNFGSVNRIVKFVDKKLRS